MHPIIAILTTYFYIFHIIIDKINFIFTFSQFVFLLFLLLFIFITVQIDGKKKATKMAYKIKLIILCYFILFYFNFILQCAACGDNIFNEMVEALDAQYHVSCFVCGNCRKPFPDGMCDCSMELGGMRKVMPRIE
jgi:LIM domain